MGGRSWARPVGGDGDAQVTLDPDDTGGGHYRIEFPFLVGDKAADDIQITDGGAIEDHRIRSDSGLPVSDLDVWLPADVDVARLIVRSRSERIVVHLPSADLLETCDRALDGDGTAVEELIDRFPSPIQLPLVCGSFLGPADTIRLIQALVRRDRYVQSMLHSYRYALVRSAVVSRTGLHVGTYRELLDLVRGLDAIEEIGAVSLVDALADVVATVHETPEETEALLERLGVDLDALFDRDDGLFAACFLAHIARSVGVEAALAYELPRPLPPRGHYDRRKRAVFRADYGDRGPAWRRLLDAARRQPADEVGYVLAYTLYWTGEESRSDSRLAELLLGGAELAAAHTGLRKIEYRARFKRLLAAGHRLRGTHCWGPSVAKFEAARDLAAEHHFLAEWKPILARGLVSSRGRSLDGDHGVAVDELDRTLERYLAADPPNSVANRSVRHLRAQKCEIESLRYWSDDPARARALLEEAREHYDAIGFDRSRDKVDRMSDGLPDVAASAAPVTAEPAGPSRQPPPTVDRLVGRANAPVGDAIEQPDVPEAMADDWLESIEYPDEDEVNEEYDETFDDPYLF